MWFAPEDIREHFKETDAEPRAAALSDAALADAAWHVIVDSDRLWALFDELCLDVLDRAEAGGQAGERRDRRWRCAPTSRTRSPPSRTRLARGVTRPLIVLADGMR